jgi:hypothetical protein
MYIREDDDAICTFTTREIKHANSQSEIQVIPIHNTHKDRDIIRPFTMIKIHHTGGHGHQPSRDRGVNMIFLFMTFVIAVAPRPPIHSRDTDHDVDQNPQT